MFVRWMDGGMQQRLWGGPWSTPPQRTSRRRRAAVQQGCTVVHADCRGGAGRLILCGRYVLLVSVSACPITSPMLDGLLFDPR